jgi:hypothetical protein
MRSRLEVCTLRSALKFHNSYLRHTPLNVVSFKVLKGSSRSIVNEESFMDSSTFVCLSNALFSRPLATRQTLELLQRVGRIQTVILRWFLHHWGFDSVIFPSRAPEPLGFSQLGAMPTRLSPCNISPRPCPFWIGDPWPSTILYNIIQALRISILLIEKILYPI